MGLQLPKIQRRHIQDLAKPSPGLAVREAQGHTAMVRSAGQLVQQVAGLGAKYIDRRNKQQLRDATLAVHKADKEFLRNYGGKAEFNANDIDDENFNELLESENMNRDQPIPAHELFADWRQKNYKAAVDSAMSGITFQGTRDQFLSDQGAKSASNYAGDTMSATKQQIRYNTTKNIEEVDGFLRQQDFKGANLAIDLADIPSDAKQRARTKVVIEEQSAYFNNAIKNRSLTDMKLALERLGDDEKYDTYNDQLTEQKQKTFANELRRSISVEENSIKSGITANYELVADDVQRQINALEDGLPVDIGQLNQNRLTLAAAGKRPTLVREAGWASKASVLTADTLTKYGPENQERVYDNVLKKAEKTGKVEDTYMVRSLRKAIDAYKSGMMTDAMSTADKHGLIVLEPVDWRTPETMASSFAQRNKQMVQIYQKDKAFTGGFTKAEFNQVGTMIENAPDKLVFAEAFINGFGDNSEWVFSELQRYGVQPVWALAGQLMAENPGNRYIAQGILDGGRMREEDTLTKDLMSKTKDTLDSFIVSNFRGIYAGNTAKQNLMADATKNLYAYYGGKRGPEEIFDQLTGGNVVNYGESTFLNPFPDRLGFSYRKTLQDVEDSVWDTMSDEVYAMSGTDVKKGLIDGDLIQLGIERGASLLMNKKDGSFVKNPDGQTNYILKLDKDTPLKSDRYRKIHEEYQARVKKEADAKKLEDAKRFQKTQEQAEML